MSDLVLPSHSPTGNVIAASDGLNTTTYAYDAMNRQVSITDAAGRTTYFGYAPTAIPMSVYDPLGRVMSSVYDIAGRLTSVVYSDASTPNVAYTYDADGQRIAMSDGTGASTFTYDSLHRLTKVVNGASATISYGYDLKGQLTTITYPGGANKVTRAYDPAGRLTSVTGTHRRPPSSTTLIRI